MEEVCGCCGRRSVSARNKIDGVIEVSGSDDLADLVMSRE